MKEKRSELFAFRTLLKYTLNEANDPIEVNPKQ